MLDALSALKHRLLPSCASPPPRRARAEPTLLTLRNLPDADTLRLAARCARSLPECASEPDPLHPFAMSPEQGTLLVAMLQRHRKVLDPDYYMQVGPEQRAALDSFFAKRAQLLDTALHVAAPPRDERHAWPDLLPVDTHADLLQQLLTRSNGLVVGEVHSAQGSKDLLIRHMPLLRRSGVDTLYLEHFQKEIHQPDLDRFHRTGQLSPALVRFIDEQDFGHMTNAERGATFRNLIDAAFQVGMRIVALDLMTSYHVRGLHDGNGLSSAASPDIRIKLMNHVATQRIINDQHLQVGKPGPQRWVALVGNGHAGSCNDIAGIAEQLGVPSLRMEDTSPTWSRRVQVGCDPGRTVSRSIQCNSGQLQCDYLLKVPIEGRILPKTPEPCSAAEAARLRGIRRAICALPDTLSA